MLGQNGYPVTPLGSRKATRRNYAEFEDTEKLPINIKCELNQIQKDSIVQYESQPPLVDLIQPQIASLCSESFFCNSDSYICNEETEQEPGQKFVFVNGLSTEVCKPNVDTVRMIDINPMHSGQTYASPHDSAIIINHGKEMPEFEGESNLLNPLSIKFKQYDKNLDYILGPMNQMLFDRHERAGYVGNEPNPFSPFQPCQSAHPFQSTNNDFHLFGSLEKLIPSGSPCSRLMTGRRTPIRRGLDRRVAITPVNPSTRFENKVLVKAHGGTARDDVMKSISHDAFLKTAQEFLTSSGSRNFDFNFSALLESYRTDANVQAVS